jgi:hypothetical protein
VVVIRIILVIEETQLQDTVFCIGETRSNCVERGATDRIVRCKWLNAVNGGYLGNGGVCPVVRNLVLETAQTLYRHLNEKIAEIASTNDWTCGSAQQC